MGLFLRLTKAYFSLNTYFIDYMKKFHKAVNSDSIRPSFKPVSTHKSDNPDLRNIVLNAKNSKEPNTTQIDSIKEKPVASLNISYFQENQIYSSDIDLASSFSFSEDEEKYE